MDFARRLRASMDDFAAGDPTSTLVIWSPSIRWYAVGSNPLAGKHVGPDDTLRYLAELSRLSGGTYRSDILEVRPMFGQTYVARLRHHAQVGDRVLDVPSSLIIDCEGDHVLSVVEVHHDEQAWDAFWSAAAAVAAALDARPPAGDRPRTGEAARSGGAT
jgi:hypothetical protein